MVFEFSFSYLLFSFKCQIQFLMLVSFQYRKSFAVFLYILVAEANNSIYTLVIVFVYYVLVCTLTILFCLRRKEKRLAFLIMDFLGSLFSRLISNISNSKLVSVIHLLITMQFTFNGRESSTGRTLPTFYLGCMDLINIKCF